MKPAIQMRIGLLVVMAFMLITAHRLSCRLMSHSYWPPDVLYMLSNIILFAVYSFGIIRKKLKTAKVVYCIWWVLTIIYCCLNIWFMFFTFMTPAGPYKISMPPSVIVGFGLALASMALAMWMGLQGLKQILKAEIKLNIQEISASGEMQD